MNIDMDAISALDEWLDNGVDDRYKRQPMAQHWARIGKVSEELGEAVQAFIGATGQNPRKGVTTTLDRVLDELADVTLTGILAIQHFTKDPMNTEAIIEERVRYRIEKMVKP